MPSKEARGKLVLFKKTCVSLFSRGKPIRNRQGKKGPSTTEHVVEKEGDWKTSSNSVPEVFQSRRGENYPNLHSVRNQLFKLSLLSPPRGKLPRARRANSVQASFALENVRALVSVNLRVYYYDE